MARYDGAQLAQESLLDVAGHVVHAIHKAPQITGRTEIRTEVLTGDDLIPVIEVMGSLAKIAQFIRWDYTVFKESYDSGNPPVLVLIGAGTTSAEMAWNCGACGFKTCAQFNKYAKENSGTGLVGGGPSCNWKVLDLGIACDWACAAAWQYSVDNRIQGSSGGAALMAGYLPGCSSILGLPLGPCRDMAWYTRETMNRKFSYEDYRAAMMRSNPSLFTAFPGGGNPQVKSRDQWWDSPEFFRPETNPEAEEKLYTCLTEVAEIVEKYRDQVSARYRK